MKIHTAAALALSALLFVLAFNIGPNLPVQFGLVVCSVSTLMLLGDSLYIVGGNVRLIDTLRRKSMEQTTAGLLMGSIAREALAGKLTEKDIIVDAGIDQRDLSEDVTELNIRLRAVAVTESVKATLAKLFADVDLSKRTPAKAFAAKENHSMKTFF